MNISQEQIDSAKATFQATGFEGDLRVGFMRAMNSGRTLLRYIKDLEIENKSLWEDSEHYEQLLRDKEDNEN